MGRQVSNGRWNKSICLPFGHMTYTQSPSEVSEKHFKLILLHLPAENHPSCQERNSGKLKIMITSEFMTQGGQSEFVTFYRLVPRIPAW